MSDDRLPASGWRPGPALGRAVVLVGAVLAAALLTGAGWLVVLVAPLLVGTVAALLDGLDARRRLVGPSGTAAPWPMATASTPAVVGQGTGVPVRVDVADAAGAQLALLRVPDVNGGPHAALTAVPVTGGRASHQGTCAVPRWGSVVVARPDLLLAGPDALLLHGPHLSPERHVVVLPLPDRVPQAPLPPRAAGLIGPHRTHRPGDGSDLLDVREFQAGDRMRRIDWRVSARRGSLHVRRTAVDSDSDVVLCLDTRYDVGDDVSDWPHPPGLGAQGTSRPGSSLDVAVRAALSLAETFLRQGDRVAVLDLARPRLSVPRGSGVRHLRRVRRQLAQAAVHLEARRLVVRQGAVPPSAVVVLLSAMLDEPIADLATSWRRSGRHVVVVDVLPRPLQPPRRSRSEQLAHRLMMAERDLRLRSLTEHGVLVTRWDPRSVPVLLRRAARARRRVA